MAAKIEQKKVTYNHPIDSKHGSSTVIQPARAAELTSSLKDAVPETNRLRVVYNVGKRPETKKMQSLLKDS